jgi:hypothetical protein
MVPTRSFVPNRIRKAAVLLGVLLYAGAAIVAGGMLRAGWMRLPDGLVAMALFLAGSAMHLYGYRQFRTLTLTPLGLTLEPDPQLRPWSELRLIDDSSRRIRMQAGEATVTLYPDSFAEPMAVREALLTGLAANRTA